MNYISAKLATNFELEEPYMRNKYGTFQQDRYLLMDIQMFVAIKIENCECFRSLKHTLKVFLPGKQKKNIL